MAEAKAGEAYLAWTAPLLDELEACNTPAEMLAVLDRVQLDTEALAEYLRDGVLGSIGAEEVNAAAHDPAERVRIAKLAADTRWKGHVKKVRTIKGRIDNAIDNPGNNFRLKRLPRSAIRKYGLPPIKKGKAWAISFGHSIYNHINNEHGDAVKQGRQKQYAVERQDLHFLIQMVAYPEKITPAKNGKEGQKRFKIERTKGQKHYIAIVQISRKRSSLVPITFYIKRK